MCILTVWMAEKYSVYDQRNGGWWEGKRVVARVSSSGATLSPDRVLAYSEADPL
jgi:hypothetical protein